MFNLGPEEARRLGVEALPETLGEALSCFEMSLFARDVLGDHAFKCFLAAKKEEWRQYRISVSSWEIEEYLHKV